MNRLDATDRARIVSALVEGNSIRSTSRMTGISRNTITKLLVELGDASAEYLNKSLVNLTCKRIQIDEIWSYVGAKQKNVTPEMLAERVCGDAWTFVAIDADTKLVISWLVGSRDTAAATDFLHDVAGRLSNRVQLTTDGHNMYLKAVANTTFEHGIDFAQLVKYYGNDPEGQKRYSPAQCMGTKREMVCGSPNPRHISTSYIERQNLTMRMSMRRFTRLTNAFSKKIENHIASVALYTMHYNFARIHQTLRVTPAMEAGISQHVWSIAEIVALVDGQSAILAA
jgi:IS1 family transposase